MLPNTATTFARTGTGRSRRPVSFPVDIARYPSPSTSLSVERPRASALRSINVYARTREECGRPWTSPAGASGFDPSTARTCVHARMYIRSRTRGRSHCKDSTDRARCARLFACARVFLLLCFRLCLRLCALLCVRARADVRFFVYGQVCVCVRACVRACVCLRLCGRGGPMDLVIYDIHALQERFYFGDNVIPVT